MSRIISAAPASSTPAALRKLGSDGYYIYEPQIYYDKANEKLYVEDINAVGGKVYLSRRILSTGNGLTIGQFVNYNPKSNLTYRCRPANPAINLTNASTAGGTKISTNNELAVRCFRLAVKPMPVEQIIFSSTTLPPET